MSERPFMQLYVSDFVGDTLALSAEGVGSYMLLLMAMWNANGSLPMDDTKLARIVRMTRRKWLTVAPEVMPFFAVEDGVVTHNRLTKELQKSERKSTIRAAAGSAGGTAKALKNNDPHVANATDLPQQNASILHIEEPNGSSPETREADPSDLCPKPAKGRISYPPDFEEFWKAYPTDANMSKKEAVDAWKRLSTDDRRAAIASIPGFLAHCSAQADYRPIHAVRYLTKRRFEGHLEASQKASTRIRIEPGGPSWRAWLEHKQRLGEPTKWMEAAGRSGDGYWVPSEWPPFEEQGMASQ